MQFLYIIEDFNISQGYSRIFEKVLTYSWDHISIYRQSLLEKRFLAMLIFYFFSGGYDPLSQMHAYENINRGEFLSSACENQFF